MILVHYGTDRFYKNKVNPIKNSNWVKPNGGFWTSPLNSTWGWKDWCDSEGWYKRGGVDKFIKLKLKRSAKLYLINSTSDLEKAPLLRMDSNYNTYPVKSYKQLKKLQKSDLHYFDRFYIDYEKLVKMGYDGIHLTDKGQSDTRWGDINLYGWDCETVLLFNTDCVYRIYN